MNYYRVTTYLPQKSVPAFTDLALDLLQPASIATGEPAEGGAAPGDGTERVELLFKGVPPQAGILLAAAAAGINPPPELTIKLLEMQDWVRESLRHLAPVQAGRFIIAGAHAPRLPSDHGVRLLIEAGLAFGTGHHETTTGCLMLIDRLVRNIRPRRVLDVGTGTGVLALAVQKTVRSALVTASDIDPIAVEVARSNARVNGTRLRCVAADGVRDPSIIGAGPYDLITANILAQPLIKLAPKFRPLLTHGGRIILAGLLRTQRRAVESAYRAQGMLPVAALNLGVWSILHLEKV